MKKWALFLSSMAITVALVYTLDTRIGTIPPLGKFLDPVNGVWHNARITALPENQEVLIPGIRDEIRIVFNERGVPHIFAKNDHDLSFAAGYLAARDRLWQMEFSTHASAGRISEIVGASAINYDRHQRRIGMKYGAEKFHEEMMALPRSRMMAEAYSDGVNAWITSLKPRELPFEYKMLDYKPESWSPMKSALYHMSMNQTLTSGTSALSMSHMMAFLGRETVEVLFPDHPHLVDPIISKGTNWPIHPDLPPAPESYFLPEILSDIQPFERDPGIGSNNWALSGSRTASGAPLMSTDPHLTLSLPSIWYEAQYNAPGINAYGITLPGVPAVIMGFNEHISWGNTNSGGLAFDLFEIELSEDGLHYKHDNQWKPLSIRFETFQIRGAPARIDTIYFTHHGPIAYLPHEHSFVREVPAGYAVQWIAHESTNSLEAFYHINRATNFSEFREGLSRLGTPTQNYVFASTDGDIAMQLNGFHPKRWQGHGKFLNDGRDPVYDWKGFIPFGELPMELNPERGFVSSANQHPVDENYPYYLGWNFASVPRGAIINKVLDGLHQATPRDMIDLLLNDENYWAELYLDRILELVDAVSSEEGFSELYASNAILIDTLKSWNRRNMAQSLAPTIFSEWMQTAAHGIWEPIFIPMKNKPFRRPPMVVSMDIILGGEYAGFYESAFGRKIEGGKHLLQELDSARLNMERNFGEMGDSWHWWRKNGSTINHLSRVEALSEPRLSIGGSRDSPSAINNAHGPSWRMVVELTNPVKAWGVYPGGQSGNPASRLYTNAIPNWKDGDLFELNLYGTVEEAASANRFFLTLKPAN